MERNFVQADSSNLPKLYAIMVGQYFRNNPDFYAAELKKEYRITQLADELYCRYQQELFPEMFRNLKVFTRMENDINEQVGEILRKRNYKPSGTGDFIDLMLECKEKGVMVGESMQKKNPDGTPETVTLEFNDGLIGAQVFVFFATGFETSSSATSYTLHQLAYNKDVQKKAQEEVIVKEKAIVRLDQRDDLLGDGLQRRFTDVSFVRFLSRKCTRPYTVPELNITIEEDTRMVVPVQALHNDPKYFPNPEEFRPERFDHKAYGASNNYFFGAGPRACERLGVMQSLAGLAAVLSIFTAEPAPESIRHPIIDPMSSIVQSIRGGLPLMFRARSKTT